MTPAALRTMRAALEWSMRDAAAASGLALGTILRAEQGEQMTPATTRRLRDAFRVRGVTCRESGEAITIRVRAAPSLVKASLSTDLLGLPHVTVSKPRADGTRRVLFAVPARLRPPGWPPTRPLPTNGRTGRLDDAEVAEIRSDARRLLDQLERARAKAADALLQKSPWKPSGTIGPENTPKGVSEQMQAEQTVSGRRGGAYKSLTP